MNNEGMSLLDTQSQPRIQFHTLTDDDSKPTEDFLPGKTTLQIRRPLLFYGDILPPFTKFGSQEMLFS